MSRKAWAYIWGALITGLLLCGLALMLYDWQEPDWILLLALIVPATISQLFEAEHGKQSFYPHFVFFFAAVVLLQPALLVLVIVVPHLIEWVKARLTNSAHLRNWYIQPVNIVGHIVPALCAHWLYDLVNTYALVVPGPAPALAAAAGVVTYIGLNHLIIGQALVLARGISWKESGILGIDNLLPDLITSILGYVVAILWTLNPWLALPGLAPLVLIYQALLVPQLKQDAQTDSKTGLWNAGHFATIYKAEVNRAERFRRPMALIMADLDLLRNINNTYGHIAGDQVLTDIGRILKETVREYDIPSRFGGEEFAIALPETTRDEACAIAERIRQAVQETRFSVATSTTPIQVTMSMGVAAFPEDALDSISLIHEADIAVYQAKLKGRNCVVSRADMPHYVKLDDTPIIDRLVSPFTPHFVAKPPDMPGSPGEPDQLDQTGSREETHGVTSEHAKRSSGNQDNQDSQDSQDNQVAVTTSSAPTGAEEHLAAVSATLMESRRGQEHEATVLTARKPDGKSQSKNHKARRRRSDQTTGKLAVFVVGVVAAGLLTTVGGIAFGGRVDPLAIVVLAALASALELLQVDVYGENTVSASVAVIFCASLLTGVEGAAVVSASIALTHYLQVRPALYKVAFNWATHLIASLAPAMSIWLMAANGANTRLEVVNIPAHFLPVLLAGAVYYLIECSLVAEAISLSRRVSIKVIWHQQFSWLVTHYLVLCILGLFLGVTYTALGPTGIVVFILPVVMMSFVQKQYIERTQDSMQELKRMNEQLNMANREVMAANQAISDFNEELFHTLARIIDARDPFVCNHASKVSDYACAIGVELGLSKERLYVLRQAGFLHDIGKIGISEAVLHKPDNLTADEYEYIKTHAALGGEFLQMSRGLHHLAPFVRHHHERWDGKGYPDGLHGDNIPLEARILSVCDAIEAMSSDRPYRQAMSLDEVLAELRRCSSTQFDPAVTAAFVRVVERDPGHLVINSAPDALRRYEERNPLARSNRNGPSLLAPIGAPQGTYIYSTAPLPVNAAAEQDSPNPTFVKRATQ